MKKIFIDSNFVIDYLRGQSYTKFLMEKIKNRQLEAYLSVVTLFELYVGALLSSDPKRKFEDIDSLVSWFYVADITREVMLIAAKIHVSLRKSGAMIEIQDILIAATSLSMNMELMTRNKKHFRDIEGLRLA